MKSTSNYKMSKPLKMRLSSTMYPRDLLQKWKRAMIDSELSAEQASKTAAKREKNKDVESE
jgi:hypothetical protein